MSEGSGRVLSEACLHLVMASLVTAVVCSSPPLRPPLTPRRCPLIFPSPDAQAAKSQLGGDLRASTELTIRKLDASGWEVGRRFTER